MGVALSLLYFPGPAIHWFLGSGNVSLLPRFHIVRAPDTIVHVTSASKALLSQGQLRMSSEATRLICDVVAGLVGEVGDGGLFAAAFASGCAKCPYPLYLNVKVCGITLMLQACVGLRRAGSAPACCARR